MIFTRIQTEMQSTSPDNLKIIKNHTIITYKQQVIRYHEIIQSGTYAIGYSPAATAFP